MAITVYPEGDYIVFKDTGLTLIETAHYGQVRWQRNVTGELDFLNIGDEFRVITSAPVGQVLDESGTPYGATIDLFNAAFTAVLPQTGGGGGGGSDAPFVQDFVFTTDPPNMAIKRVTVRDPLTGLTTSRYFDGIVEIFSPDLEEDADVLQSIKNNVIFIADRLALGYTIEKRIISTLGLITIDAGQRKITLTALAGSSFIYKGITYPLLTANGVIDRVSVGNGINPIQPDQEYEVLAGSVLEELER
jgi:hypothetical protein